MLPVVTTGDFEHRRGIGATYQRFDATQGHTERLLADSNEAIHALLQLLDEVGAVDERWLVGQAWLPDAEYGGLALTATWHRDTTDPTGSARNVACASTDGAALAETVRVTGLSDWIDDFTSGNESCVEGGSDVGRLTALSVPVKANQLVVAVVVVFAEGSLPRDDRQIRTIESLASDLGASLENICVDKIPSAAADRWNSFLEHVPAMVSMKGLDGELLLTNDAAATTLLEDCIAVDDAPRSPAGAEALDTSNTVASRANDLRVARSATAETFEETAMLADGEHWYSSVRFPVFDSGGEMIGVGAICTDITESRKAGQQISRAHRLLERRALHDSLTGLPNRAQLIERLGTLVAMGPRSTALLFVDLDDFKDINDTHGHAEGDVLLHDVAIRLRGSIRPGDLLARLGGDEFGVLLEDTDTQTAEILAQRIVDAMDGAFVVAGESVQVTASVGVAASSLDGEDANRLLCFADLALYEAKSNGKGRFASFDPTMSDALTDRTRTDRELRNAIEQGQLVLHYQPVIDLSTGTMAGVEALVRWQHPERGLLGPDQFVPRAERTGTIAALGAWVLETACRQAAAWRIASPSGPPIVMSVNVSARQLDDPAFVSTVASILETTGFDSAQLCLEVTETAMMSNSPATQEAVHALRYLGVGLAIDDFGTGYASLTYLRRLHATIVKIDKSFVDGLGREHQDTTIVKAVIGLSHAMGLSVTAEGVETIEQLNALRALGCQYGQGFYFCRPVPAQELEGKLQRLWLEPTTRSWRSKSRKQLAPERPDKEWVARRLASPVSAG